MSFMSYYLPSIYEIYGNRHSPVYVLVCRFIPLNPALHEHENEPNSFVQVALASHGE